MLPNWLETFVKNACFYFSKSSKRKHQFQLMQEVAEAPKHRILKLAQTRWLSMEAVISRLIQQWDTLKLYSPSQSATDKVDGAGLLFQVMSTSGTKHMLLFLAFILTNGDWAATITVPRALPNVARLTISLDDYEDSVEYEENEISIQVTKAVRCNYAQIQAAIWKTRRAGTLQPPKKTQISYTSRLRPGEPKIYLYKKSRGEGDPASPVGFTPSKN